MTPTETPLQTGAPLAIARRFVADDRGATAVEYGLIVACVALLIVGGVSAAGTNIAGTMTKISNALR